MHVINLGVCLWSCGSTLRVLLDQYPHLWSGDVLKSDNDRLAIAYEEFRAWTRQQKIPFLDIHIRTYTFSPVLFNVYTLGFQKVSGLTYYGSGFSQVLHLGLSSS